VKHQIQIASPVVGEKEWQALREPLESGWLTQGPKVAAFERAFATRHDVAHAIATTSCTTALHLALASLGIKPGDEVILPSFTWVATANVVLYCGARPVLADVDRETFNIDIDHALSLVTERTRAVIPVHLFGLCADIDALRAGLREDVFVVEDAACAAGAAYKGRSAGGLGDVAAFSFHPRKAITTGEGGMVTTNAAETADLAISLRNHGASVSEEERHRGPKPYILADFNVLGFNYRMTDLQAAIGIVQLSQLDDFIAFRARWAAWYSQALGGIPWLRLPREPNNGRHAWQAYVTYVDPEEAPLPRDAIMERLQAEGIATRPGTHAVHTLGYYRDRFGMKPGDFPASADCAANSLTLPLHSRMSEADFAHISRVLSSIGR
jgi:perosamine synthetase